MGGCYEARLTKYQTKSFFSTELACYQTGLIGTGLSALVQDQPQFNPILTVLVED